jgi:Tol biopolymer transport system component
METTGRGERRAADETAPGTAGTHMDLREMSEGRSRLSCALRWTGVALAAALACGLARAQTTERVSVATGGTQGNNTSEYPSISADGRFVAFHSPASNLVVGDTNGAADVFVRDRQSGTTERVSVATGGTEGNFDSYYPSISADGRFVAFHSFASNLVLGDTNGAADIFVRDRQSGTTERVSVATGGTQGNGHSYIPSISRDGRFVAFFSLASNLVAGDTNGFFDVFVRDRQSGTTERVSLATGGAEGNFDSYWPSISADGRFVAFQSAASNLVPGDTNSYIDIFVRDRQSGTTERVSLATGGAEGNSNSGNPSISADGRFVALGSTASNLVVGDTNGFDDIFVRDRQSGTTGRVSVATGGEQGNGYSYNPSISADGRFVAFLSAATNLVAGDTNGAWDYFVRDRQSRTTERVSMDSGGAQGNLDSYTGSISTDGGFVAFWSDATNLVAGDTNGAADIFVRDRRQPPIVASCFGDGTGIPCPCGNSGLAGHGCENSSSTGGALLSASGSPSLSSDTLVLTSSGERPTALSIFLQGNALIAPVTYGDGLRCAGGTLKRLYVKNAVGGVAIAPQAGDPSVSARSAALGNPIPMGATRHYQTYYRDPNPVFCPNPQGDTWNISSGLSAVWGP